MCGGGTSTSTNLSTADPRVSANYDYITGRAKGVADIPYQYYPGNLVAGVPGQMQSGFDIINQTQGVASPFISRAAQYAQQGAAPISAGAIQSYMNPYQQNVIDATMANIDEMNGRQQQDVIGNAISKGAWGGDRAGVAQAELARQQGLAAGQTLAGLQSQGYGQALTAAQQDAQRQSQAAYTMGALGQEAQSTALTGANAQIGAGQLQQQQGQNQINADYSQFQQARQYPFNTSQWLAAILGGQAGQLGGTSTTTAPAPGIAQQAIGAGAGIAGILGATGAFGSSGWLWSDERLKENIEPIGRAFDGQMIYRYNFKGDPKTQIGFLAQEVERHAPGAVHEIDGIKGVDYHDATDEAADRGGFATGGITAMNAPMIPSIDSYTPETNSPAFGPLVAQGYELKSITKPAYEQATRGGFDDGGMVPYGAGTPFPQLGTVNGMPVPLAANPVQSFSAPPLTAGRSRMPTAPKVGGQSDIGTDVVRMAQMLRSYGFGKRPGGAGQPQSYGSVGDLVSAQGLKSGGRAPRADGGGGSDVPDDDGLSWVTVPMPPSQWSPPVTALMPRAAMAPPTPIDLPYAPDYSRAERSEPPRDFVPITTALASLRDEMQGAPVPAGVAPAPAPDVAPVTVAAAPTGVAGRAFPSDYAARIARTEFGASPRGTTNPDTGAGTEYQFMPATAYGLAQRTAWGRGLSPPQVMAAIQADDAKRDEILGLYNQVSTSVLGRAGIPASDANMFALHAFGPAGGLSLLRADPATPVADWVRSVRWDNGATPEQVIAQNGLGKYRTVGDLRRGFIEARIGGPSPSGVAVAGARPGGAGVAPDDGGDGEGAGVEGDSVPPAGASGVAAPPPDDSGEGIATRKDGVAKDGSGGGMERFLSSPWLALAALGFGMAGSRNPRALGALGEGGLQGVQVAQAQLKNARELQQAKAMEAYRNAHLAISGRQADRQMQLAEETMRRNAANEAARNRQVDVQEGRLSETERRNQQTEDFKRTALSKFNPDPAKATDPATGWPIYRNGLGEERLMSPKGLVSREDARGAATYKFDPMQDRTIPLSGGDITIPALDERELTLDPKIKLEANKRYGEILNSAKSAGDVQRQIDELKKAYAALPTSGIGAPGAAAEASRRIMRAGNALSDALGLPSFFNKDAVGNLDEMKKGTIALAAAATKAFNSNRPTNFDFEQMLQGTPGAQLGPEAFLKVVGAMEAQAARQRDLGKYATEYIKHRRTAFGVEDQFLAQRPDNFYFKGIPTVSDRGQPGAGPAPSTGAAPRVMTKDEYDKIPSGGTYIDGRTGQTKRKQ